MSATVFGARPAFDSALRNLRIVGVRSWRTSLSPSYGAMWVVNMER